LVNNLITTINLVILAIALAGDHLLTVSIPGLGTIPILDIVVFILAVQGLLRYYYSQHSVLPLFIWWAYLFIAIAGISLIGSGRWLTLPTIIQSSLFWWRWIAYFGLVFWVSQLNTHFKQWLINILGMTWAVVAVLGWVQLLVMPNLGFLERWGWDPHQSRIVSTFLDPNLLGGFLLLGLAMSLGQLLMAKLSSRQKIYWQGLAALLFISIIFTYSRSSLIGLIVLGLFVSRRYWKIVILGLVAIILVFALSPRLQERLQGVVTIDDTARYRLESWGKAVNIIKQEPWLGVGYNTLKFSRDRYDYQPQSHASSGFDSSLLTIGATTGLLGLAIYLMFLLATLKWVRQHLVSVFPGVALAYLMGTGVLFIHSIFVNSWLYSPIMAVGWIMIGLIWINNTSDV